MIDYSKLYIKVFLSKNGGLLGSILSSLKIKEVDDLPVLARVNNSELHLHKERFFQMEPQHQLFVLLHELWHIALLHLPRGIGKYSNVWNKACDVRINNDLIAEGFSMPDEKETGIYDLSVDEPTKKSEEELYEKYLQDTPEDQRGETNNESKSDNELKQEIHQHITLARQALVSCHSKDATVATIRTIIDSLTCKPLPWHTLLYEYLQSHPDIEPVWARPHRRYLASGLYLPSVQQLPQAIEHLAVYIDTSGSVTDEELSMIAHELQSIVAALTIARCTVYSFDTSIQSSFELQDDPQLTSLLGFGGTDLQCAVNHMASHPADVAVVFSDLEDDEPAVVSGLPPIVWVQTADKPDSCKPSFGKVISL